MTDTAVNAGIPAPTLQVIGAGLGRTGTAAHGPFAPSARTGTTLTVALPSTIPLGYGFATVVVVNTDPHWTQHGWVQMPIWEMGIGERAQYVVEDLLDGARYTWRGAWNYVKLDPAEKVAHVFVVRDPGSGTRDPLRYSL